MILSGRFGTPSDFEWPSKLDRAITAGTLLAGLTATTNADDAAALARGLAEEGDS